MYNSTIKDKVGYCVDCNDGREKRLVAGRCANHYSKHRNLISQQRIAKREATKGNMTVDEKELCDLVADCDALFSRYIRLKHSDKEGNCKCFTCGIKKSWKVLQAGHYIGRAVMFLRFDERNVKPQCEKCNCFMDGNISEYTFRLERENKGITEILLEEARIIHKWTRDELRQLRSELTQKIELLKQHI